MNMQTFQGARSGLDGIPAAETVAQAMSIGERGELIIAGGTRG